MKDMEFKKLPLDKIDISVSNVRKSKLEEGIDELANSIKEIELQQPIVVFQKKDGRYDLLIGQRRVLAFKKLGRKEIPSLITYPQNDTDAMIISFSENIHRLDLKWRDKMAVATELLSKLKKVDKVALCLGVQPQTVRNWLGYSDVPESLKRKVDSKTLSASTAKYIWKNIQDEKKALEIAEKIIETVPRSEDRVKIVEIAKENPQLSIEDVLKKQKNQKYKQVSIDLTPRMSEALEKAVEQFKSDDKFIDEKYITLDALEEWLKSRGFLIG